MVNIMEIDGLNINYIKYGKGKPIVLLHGWGQNIEMMNILGKELDGFEKIIIDFPGFGESDEPKEAWTISDYVEMLHKLLNKLKVKKPIIIGHSFGGRVAIKYSSKYDVEKLVLFGTPCIVEKDPDSLKVKTLKTLKRLPGMNKFGEYMKKYIGSTDYKNASKIMREILVNSINEDLQEDLKQITSPTLIIWGEQDFEAPIIHAKKEEELIKDAGLIVLPGTHYAYIENLGQVVNILREFL